MASIFLNRNSFVLQLKQGTRANLLKVANYFLQGELVYTTDGKQLFIGDASYIPQPVQSLDMAVVDDSGNIVTDSGGVVFNF